MGINEKYMKTPKSTHTISNLFKRCSDQLLPGIRPRNVSGKFPEQEPPSLPVETKTLNPGYEHLLSLSHFVNEYKLSNKLLFQVNRYNILKEWYSHVFSYIYSKI